MKRRTILLAMGTTMATCAGCLSRTQAAKGPEDPSTTELPQKQLSEYSCPPYELDKPAACSQTITQETAIYTTPSIRKTSRPLEDLEITLHNTRAQPVEFNSGNWKIHANQGASWNEVEQDVVADGKMTLESHSTQTWSFSEIMSEYNPSFQFKPGDYTAALTVLDPKRDQYIACISLFRVIK